MSRAILLIITQNLPPAICGVGDYATMFGQELKRQTPNLEVAFLTRPQGQIGVNYTSEAMASEFLGQASVYASSPHRWNLLHLPAMLKNVRRSKATTVHIHYVPQMYYRAGVGVALSVFAVLLRLLKIRVVVTFHELYIPLSYKPKLFLIGQVQRFSLLLMLLALNEAVVTTRLSLIRVSRLLFWNKAKLRRVVLSPIGSNFPVTQPALTAQQRQLLRKENDLPPAGLILGCIGQPRWQEQSDWLLAALDAVQQTQPTARLLLIGCPLDKLPLHHPIAKRTDVICTGYCTSRQVSTLLACTDIYLLPLDDGVSSRRGSLMAALQHGLPIVSTSGSSSEPEFVRNLPAMLAPVTDKALFVKLAVELAGDAEGSVLLGQRAKAYYFENFDWAVLVKQQKPLFFNNNTGKDKKGESCCNIVAKEDSVSTILFINGAAERGGGEVVLQNTVTNLDPNRFRPVVIFLSPGPLVAEFKKAGIATYLIDAKRFSNPITTIRTVARIVSIIKNEKVAMVQSAGGKGHIYGGMAAWFTGYPAILLMQDLPEQPSKWDKFSKRVPMEVVITNSKSTLQKAKTFFPKVRAELAYPGTDVAGFSAAPNLQIRAQLNLKPDQPAIGIFSRLQHWKGVHIFIDAAALVQAKFPEARFFIIGDTLFGLEASYRIELENQIIRRGLQNVVQMLGFRQDVPDIMRAMDIIVSSSVLPESFGLTIVEAMLSGRPVVASAHGGPTEIIEQGYDGFLVKPDDAQALANQVLALIDNPELRQRIGEQARISATKRFSLEVMLEQLQTIYASIERNIKIRKLFLERNYSDATSK